MNQERLLKWLENERKKDEIKVDNEKNKLISELKKISKKEIFEPNQKPQKLSLWKKIRIMIWGD